MSLFAAVVSGAPRLETMPIDFGTLYSVFAHNSPDGFVLEFIFTKRQLPTRSTDENTLFYFAAVSSSDFFRCDLVCLFSSVPFSQLMKSLWQESRSMKSRLRGKNMLAKQ